MSDDPQRSGPEWHPFTPAGVAGAAVAPRWQLWVVLCTTALLSAVVLVSFLQTCWQPVIQEAIGNLPPKGFILGHVYHPGEDTTDKLLAENHFLQISVNWNPRHVGSEVSDVRVVLQIDRVVICSALGCSMVSYAALGDRSLGRLDTMAWWDAWWPFLLLGVAIGHILFLFLSWSLLTVLWSGAIRLLAFYQDRSVDFAGSCRMAQASMVPGALWVVAALFSYERGWLDLPSLLVLFVLHVPLAVVYFALAVRQLPMRPQVIVGNPFSSAEEPGAGPTADNPFKGPPGAGGNA